MFNYRKSALTGAVVAAITALAVSQSAAQTCRGGLVFDSVTGNPVLNPGTNTQAKCDSNQAQNTGDANGLASPSNGLLIAGGTAAVVGGVLGGLAASGNLSGASNTQASGSPLLPNPPQPVSGQ